MNRAHILLQALAASLALTSGAVAGAVDKAGPRETVSIERAHAPAVRYAALEIDPADLAAHGSKASTDCVVRRAGPRDTVRMNARC
jgi:hypothetical protein